jgi:hypothetical protein
MESCRKIFNEPVDINLTNEIIVPDRKEPTTLVGVGIQQVYIQGENHSSMVKKRLLRATVLQLIYMYE